MRLFPYILLCFLLSTVINFVLVFTSLIEIYNSRYTVYKPDTLLLLLWDDILLIMYILNNCTDLCSLRSICYVRIHIINNNSSSENDFTRSVIDIDFTISYDNYITLCMKHISHYDYSHLYLQGRESENKMTHT